MLKVSTAQEKKQWDPKGEREREKRERKLEGAYFSLAQHQIMPMQEDHKNLDFNNKSMMLL